MKYSCYNSPATCGEVNEWGCQALELSGGNIPIYGEEFEGKYKKKGIF